jgi:hypothetical protein
MGNYCRSAASHMGSRLVKLEGFVRLNDLQLHSSSKIRQDQTRSNKIKLISQLIKRINQLVKQDQTYQSTDQAYQSTDQTLEAFKEN